MLIINKMCGVGTYQSIIPLTLSGLCVIYYHSITWLMEISLHLLVLKVVSGQWSVRFYANTLYLQDDTKKIVIIYI